jgi:site-specific recombinase XerD
MSEKPISPLRRRMIEDMTVRNFVEKTRNDYIRHVRTFTAFLGRSPDTATPEDLRRFQLHQTQTGVRPPSINGSVAALRFFFTVTLDRPEMARHLTFVREPRKIPAVLSPEEVARLLEAAPGPKYKAALSAAYGAGLRVSEVVALKVSDIDSERLLLRIEQGKGRKDRFAMLSPKLLELLRDWYRIARPTVWLFPGRDPMLPMSSSAAFSATSCRKASTASATTACSPRVPVPTTSRGRANCSPCQSLKASLPMLTPPIPTSRRPSRILVRAAAAAWSSSRPSRAAASRATHHQLQPVPSGSTRHDHDHWITTTQCRSRLSLVLNRLRRHSAKYAVRPSKQARNGHTQRPSQPSTRAAVARQVRQGPRPSASRSFAHTLRVSQIPIAQCAAPSAHHRPRVRSLAASGRRPRCSWLRKPWPASETLHTSRP